MIEMKIKERNTTITIISFVTGVFLLSFILPKILEMILVPNYSSYVFSRLYGYLYIDFSILAIPLFLYAYFLLKPINTLRGKKILSFGAIIFGGILISFLIIAVVSELDYRFFYGYDFDTIDLINIILCIVILLPAIALIIHGSLLMKTIPSRKNKKLKDIGLKERKIILVIISLMCGIFLLTLVLPRFIAIVSYNVLLYFTSPFGYLYLDLIVLAIPLFLYAYFMIRPMKTLRGKKILSLGEMIFGGILFLLALIAFVLDMCLYGYTFSGGRIFYMSLYLLVLLPGVPLFVHGWYIKRSTASEER